MWMTIALEGKQKGREGNNLFFMRGLSTTYYFCKRFCVVFFIINRRVYKMVYKQSQS